ncbi:type 2 lantipeptide synthetase LanM [Staphylococcus caprae]|uniref:type 2 lanthipeptide synthetase LanM n=1 Tax=Staphylococcus caprae TaxID=29380 RepID=UPI001C838BE1|nr:type 2 lanthipeptide synthetase LanM [Staphylococcus caprae]MBX5320274.1 type 2 lantipeptide synthetase LanM [Staphylococcus caprae]
MNSNIYLKNSLYSFERKVKKEYEDNLKEKLLEKWKKRSNLDNIDFLKRLKEYNFNEQNFKIILNHNDTYYENEDELIKIINIYSTNHNSYNYIEGLGEFLIPFINYFNSELNNTHELHNQHISIRNFKESISKALYFSLRKISDQTIVLEFQKNLQSTRGSLIEKYKRESLKNRQYHKYLLKKYPVLYRCLFEIVQRELINIKKFINNLNEDYLEICKMFFDNKKLKLKSVFKGVGDTHNNGKSVMICNFEKGKKLVYKPRSLKVDIAFSKLIRTLNQSENILYDLGTIRTIDKQEYGWQEYIEHKECQHEEGIHKCYYRMGLLLGLMHAFKTNDMHYENIIISGDHPYIIDLETIITNSNIFNIDKKTPLEKLYNSIYSTGMLPTGKLFPTYVDNDISGLTGLPNQKSKIIKNWFIVEDNTDNVRFEHREFITEEVKHLIKQNGEIINPYNYLSTILNGFEAVYQYILKNKQLFINFIEKNLENCNCRTIIRSTYTYSKFLSTSYHPNYLSNGLDRELLFELMWDKIHQDKKFFPTIKHEIKSLLNNDIPYFYFNTSSKDIFTNNTSIPDFFENTAIDSLKEQINNFNTDDLYIQKQFIYNSINNHELQKYDVNSIEKGITKNILNSEKPMSPYLIADKIISNNMLTSLDRENSLWIGLEIDVERNTYNLSTLDFSLYNGIPGILIFLSEVYSKTKDEKYLNACINSVNFISKNIEYNAEHLSASMFNGIGGISYACFYIYENTKKNIFKNLAEKYWEIMLQKLTDSKDFSIDFLDGLSGNIIFCIELYKKYKNKRYLNAAYTLSKLLENKVNSVYKIRQNINLTGMGHGVSGVILAFKEINNHFPEFHSVIINLMNYEDNNFDETILNWKDLRKEINTDNNQVNYWCHGRPGILLGRYFPTNYKTLLSENILYEIIEKSLDMTLNMERLGLCHGVFGNLEIFKYIYKYSEDKLDLKDIELIKSNILNQDDFNIKINSLLENNLIGLMTGITGVALSLLKDIETPVEILLLKLPCLKE